MDSIELESFYHIGLTQSSYGSREQNIVSTKSPMALRVSHQNRPSLGTYRSVPPSQVVLHEISENHAISCTKLNYFSDSWFVSVDLVVGSEKSSQCGDWIQQPIDPAPMHFSPL